MKNTFSLGRTSRQAYLVWKKRFPFQTGEPHGWPEEVLLLVVGSAEPLCYIIMKWILELGVFLNGFH